LTFALDTLLTLRQGKPRNVLTPRGCAAVQLIAVGNANKSASARLRVSLKTVETHRAAATRKPGLRSTANLVRSAVPNRMIDV
jgi:DNA-binding NarL/FixJ family response regulator